MTRGPRHNWRLFVRLLNLARPYWWHLAGVFALGMVAPPLALLAPVPLALVIDSVLGQRPPMSFLRLLLPDSWLASPGPILAVAAAMIVGVALLNLTQSLCIWLLQTYTGEKLVVEFRALLFRHAQRLSLAYHDRRGVTDSLYRIQYDTMSVQAVTVNGVVPLVTALVTLAGMVAVISILNWQLTLIALAICPVIYVVARRYGDRLQSMWESVKDLDSHSMAVVQETLSAVRVVKAYGQESREHGRFLDQSTERVRGQIALARTEATMDLLIGVLLAAGTAAVLVVGVLSVQAGRLSLGQLVIVMSYIAQLYEPLRTMSKRLAEIQSGLAGAGRAFELLDQLPEVPEKPGALPLVRARGQIRFHNVSFGYTPEHVILKQISLDVPPGARVAIRGPTGSGKTTLISLLMRFFDPLDGAILLDGWDLRDYRLADLRRQFALVLQEPVLFSASIAENIAYGNPGAPAKAIVEAARMAEADAFIRSLPAGYETQVGERGMSFSGGERQRIALARAFLRDAPILILDEPTSALDLQTESRLMEALARLMRNRTSFVVSHRLSLLDLCDLHLELPDGRVLSAGKITPATTREDH
jgi:ATP-binding cassette subfamily B protein